MRKGYPTFFSFPADTQLLSHFHDLLCEKFGSRRIRRNSSFFSPPRDLRATRKKFKKIRKNVISWVSARKLNGAPLCINMRERKIDAWQDPGTFWLGAPNPGGVGTLRDLDGLRTPTNALVHVSRMYRQELSLTSAGPCSQAGPASA